VKRLSSANYTKVIGDADVCGKDYKVWRTARVAEGLQLLKVASLDRYIGDADLHRSRGV
jgi:hypothetical protein